MRPNATSGSTMIGIAASTKHDRRGLVTTIMVAEPTNSTKLRTTVEIDTPTADLICVVSADRREINSRVISLSKNAGDSLVTCSNTAARTSATTRSPIVVTR